jgi:hypothetical protein
MIVAVGLSKNIVVEILVVIVETVRSLWIPSLNIGVIFETFLFYFRERRIAVLVERVLL